MTKEKERERTKERVKFQLVVFLAPDFGEVIKHMSLLNEFYHVWILRCSD